MVLASHLHRPSPGARQRWDGLGATVAHRAPGLDRSARETLRGILWEDVLSEYDARFFSAHVLSLGLELGDEFLEVERRWAADEARHYRHMRETYEALLGADPDLERELDERRPDFEPLEPLFDDELSIACLCAYDELATVRAYRANLPHYDRLGPEFGRFVRGVIADEAWHYGSFLAIVLGRHAHRLDDAQRALERIRAAEGTPYAATFVLDHDDPVFTESILAESYRILARQLERARRALRL